MKRIYILTIFILLASSNISADTGTTSAAFLKIGVGAKYLALGDVGAVSRDVNSIYYNPAGLSFLDRKEVSFMHLKWFDDISYQAVAFAYPLKNRFTLGLAYNRLSMGDIKEYDVYDNPLNETYSPSDSMATFALSAKMNDDLNLGANLKYIDSILEKERASTFAADAGATYVCSDVIVLGFAVQNAGGTLKYVQENERLPLNFKLGGSYLLNIKEYFHPALRPQFFLDLNQNIERDIFFNLGAELGFVFSDDYEYLLRVGYKSRDKAEDWLGISAGLGFVYKNLNIDFAWLPYGKLGYNYAFSMGFGFGKPSEEF